ncbi:MAG: hypothetical protein OEU26_20200 [Candidatus Tectomicrobia bacterium]|nr:hypothetical protein [Candidatus Tectomicrobia bacterium]
MPFLKPGQESTLPISIKNWIDDGQCDQTVRELGWPEGMIAVFA